MGGIRAGYSRIASRKCTLISRRRSQLGLTTVVGMLCVIAMSHAIGPARFKVVGTRVDYCDADAGLAVAKVHVRLVFRNPGPETIILSRSFGPTESLRVTDMSGREVLRPDDHFLETQNIELGAAPNDSLFERIMPGMTVYRDFVVSVPISKNSHRRITGSVFQGSYHLTATRALWPLYGDEARAKKMQREWKKYGQLDLSPVTVRALLIHLKSPPQMEACASADPSD